MQDFGRSVILILFDASNAFACITNDRLIAAAESWLGPEGGHCQAGLSTWLTSTIAGNHELYHFKPQGCMQGHVWAPSLIRH